MRAAKILFTFLFIACSMHGRAQNVVLLKAHDYFVFRWGADTLDTALFTDFFLTVYNDGDTLTASSLAHNCVYFLRQNETGVDALDAKMRASLWVGLAEYACFVRMRESHPKIIRE